MIEVNIESVLSDGINIPASLDALDAAVLVYLVDRFGEKAKQWRTELVNQVLVTYTLVDESGWTRLGPWGELQLRKINNKSANLRPILPAIPSNDETLMYLAGWPYQSENPAQTPFFAESKLRETVTQELTVSNPSFDPWFESPKVEAAMLAAISAGRERLYQGRLAQLKVFVQEILERLHQDDIWKDTQPETLKAQKKQQMAMQPGNPGLSFHEQTYRVAMAIWAEELRQQDSSKPWKEIARQICWPYGLKLLEDARSRLVKARKAQNDLYADACQLAEQLKQKS
jgi:hypothetical protein